MPPGQIELIVAKTLAESAITQAVQPQKDSEIGVEAWVFSALWWLAVAAALLLVRQLAMLVHEQQRLQRENRTLRHDFDNCPHRPEHTRAIGKPVAPMNEYELPIVTDDE